MKALIATVDGDVDKLTVADVREPQIGPGDVKVKAHAASIALALDSCGGVAPSQCALARV